MKTVMLAAAVLLATSAAYAEDGATGNANKPGITGNNQTSPTTGSGSMSATSPYKMPPTTQTDANRKATGSSLNEKPAAQGTSK